MIQEIQAAFRGKTVLVTGHTGFKGSWLSLWLSKLGARVAGYSLPAPTSPSNYLLSRVREVLDSETIADIRDSDRMIRCINESRPDFLFHLAAQTVVKTGFESPKETFDVNVVGTAAVLDAFGQMKDPCTCVCITSDKCYANDDRPRPFVESDPMGERDPYGASKGCSELVINAYFHSYFHPRRYESHRKAIASARAGNVIGGGDWTAHALVPDLVESARTGTPIVLRNPQATRPWQHVLQTLSGYLLLAARLDREPAKYCGGWNFGPIESEVLNVADFSAMFFKSWGSGAWRDGSNTEQHQEAQALTLSIRQSVEQLGWSPRWDIEQTIQKTVDWYKRFLAGENPVDLCTQQIEEFEQSM